MSHIFMADNIDLSLNRSLKEMIASYWEALNAGIDDERESLNDFYALEDYLSSVGAV